MPTTVVFIFHTSILIIWTPPPTGFITISFDGASKGNLGPMGFKEILRNSNG
jgi:hypothetical protein